MGGTLHGTGNAAVARISKLGLRNGPDLDLGFNDFLDARVQLPANFAGDLHLHYGSTFAPGINAARVLTIPNARIPKDGAAHVYRFDLGLEVPWRGTLTDLEIALALPPGVPLVAGVPFALDYVRVGDQGEQTCTSRASRRSARPRAGRRLPRPCSARARACIPWNRSISASSGTTPWRRTLPGTANMAHGTLRNAEEVWQLYVKKLGYREPCYATETGGGPRYKVNITSWHGGYWMGGDTDGGASLARFNITPDGLRVDPPTWVLPHELMHGFQMHNTSGYVPGFLVGRTRQLRP